MKNKMKKNLFRGILMTLIVSTVLCAALMAMPQKAAAEAESVFGLKPIDGTVMLGTTALQDPVKVTNEGTDQYYMDPQSYLYFGVVSTASGRSVEPILWRILDNDRDNAGNSGAAFLLSENVISSTARFSSKYDDNWNHDDGFEVYLIGRYENTYNGSYLAEYENALKSFYAEEKSAIRSITKDDAADIIEQGFGYIEAVDEAASLSFYGEEFVLKLSNEEEQRFYFDDAVYAESRELVLMKKDETGALIPITNARNLSFVLNEQGIPHLMMYQPAQSTATMPYETNVYVLEKAYGDDLYGDYTIKRSFWITANQHQVTFAESYENEALVEGDSYHKPALEGERIFPLSVAELERYVANYSGAPGMSATLINTNSPTPWILRTAYDNDVFFDQIGYVTAEGTVKSIDADSSLGGRYGINVELDQIEYLAAVNAEKTAWRPAMRSSLYSGETQFEAMVVDSTRTENGLRVDVEYKNAISRIGSVELPEDDYISAMVVRNGEVRHYGAVDYAYDADLKYNQIDTEARTVSFDLPADFDQAAGDELYVFWERKYDDERLTSYISNMAKVACVHESDTPATCSTRKVCKHCGVEIGELDPDNHSGELTWVESATSMEHWQDCTDCDAEIGREACTVEANCTNVTLVCECGRDDPDPNGHDYDQNGVCRIDPNHYETPEKEGDVYLISKTGHLLWLADQVNHQDNATVNARIAYEGTEWDLSGMEFVPIGYDPSTPYSGSFDGNGVILSNVELIDNYNYMGFFGVTKGATVENVVLQNCSFRGIRCVGALIGKSESTTVKNCTALSGTVAGTSGVDTSLGGLVGETDTATVLQNCISYDVVDGAEAYLPLVENGSPTVTNCFYLTDAENENGGRTQAQFASGEIAYLLGDGWGQSIGNENYPVLGGNKIYNLTNCTGEDGYTNDPDGYDVHSFNTVLEFLWSDNYEYCEAVLKCDACGETLTVPCDDYEGVRNGKTRIDYNFGGVRVEYSASVILSNGDREYAEDKYAIIKTIKDVTAVEPITKTFDGLSVSAVDMLRNTQMKYWDVPSGMREFDAFFMPAGTVTEETVSEISSFTMYRNQGVTAAGSYDLIVVGRRNYDYQIAIFENVLTIEKATLTLVVTPHDRPEDETLDFAYDVSFAEETDLHLDWLRVSVSKPSSHIVGSYTLNVTLNYRKGTEHYSTDANGNFETDSNGNYVKYYEFDGFKESVNLTWSETVTLEILRRVEVQVEYKNWAEQYVDSDDANYNGISDEILIPYGTPVPTPTAENFTASAGSELRYEWYELVYTNTWDYEYKKLNAVPVNAGDYCLRVIGGATADLVEGYLDIVFTITRKPLEVVIDPAVSYETYEEPIGEQTRIWYILNASDPWPSFLVQGFAYGDTVESAGINVSTYPRHESYFSEINELYPMGVAYIYSVNAVQGSSFGIPENYETENASFYVVRLLPTDMAPADATYSWDGNAKSVTVSVQHPVSTQIPADGEALDYQVIVTDENDTVIYSDSGYAYVNTLEFDITAEGAYSVLVQSRLLYSEDTSWKDVASYSFTVNFTDAYAEADSGDGVDELREVGKYLVSVITGDVTNTAHVVIYRELHIYVKESSIELDDSGDVPFDVKNLVFEAGYVPMLGHTITDLDFHIRTDSHYGGEITVVGWTIMNASGVDVSELYTVNTTIYSWNHTNGGLNVIHLFDNACDSTCNVNGCSVTRAPAPHTGGTATCQSQAICEVCGMYYGNPDGYNHTSEDSLYVPDQYNGMLHHQVHACCGAVILTEEHHADVVATCTDQAICKVCNSEGVSFGEIDPDNHTSTEHTYESNGAFTHKVFHACCSVYIEDENHSGGDATCVTLAVCQYCGDSYGDFDADDHEKADQATYEADGKTHLASYPCCDAVVREDHSGGVATCTTLALCQHCDTPYGELNPENHASEALDYTLSKTSRARHDVTRHCCGALVRTETHSGGEATCLAKASCQHCDTPYGTKDLTNHASEALVCEMNMINRDTHDQYHACCGEWASTAAHSGGTATCQTPAACAGCGAYYGEKLAHVYDHDCDYTCNLCLQETRAMRYHEDANADNACDHCSEEMSETQTVTVQGQNATAVTVELPTAVLQTTKETEQTLPETFKGALE